MDGTKNAIRPALYRLEAIGVPQVVQKVCAPTQGQTVSSEWRVVEASGVDSYPLVLPPAVILADGTVESDLIGLGDKDGAHGGAVRLSTVLAVANQHVQGLAAHTVLHGATVALPGDDALRGGRARHTRCAHVAARLVEAVHPETSLGCLALNCAAHGSRAAVSV